MSWYQEALDCYAMLRSSCNELNTKYSDFSYIPNNILSLFNLKFLRSL